MHVAVLQCIMGDFFLYEAKSDVFNTNTAM